MLDPNRSNRFLENVGIVLGAGSLITILLALVLFFVVAIIAAAHYSGLAGGLVVALAIMAGLISQYDRINHMPSQ